MSVEFELYAVLAAMSLSLAALASLISLFRDAESYNEGDIYIFRAIVMTCFFMLIGALLPLTLSPLVDAEDAVNEQIVRAVLDLVYAFAVAYLLSSDLQKMLNGNLGVVNRRLTLFMVAGSIVMIVWGVLNAIFLQTIYFYPIGLTWGTVVISIRLYLLFISATRTILEEAQKRAEIERHTFRE